MQVTGTLQNLINKPCWTLYLNWTDKNSKDKEYIVVKVISIVWTAVHFFSTCQELYRFLVIGGFELSTVKNKSKCVKEIQEKSILVRVSARFELPWVEFSGVNCTLTALHSSFTYWEELAFKIAFELS